MGYKFPSEAWTDQFYKEINESDAYASAAQHWEGDFVLNIEEHGAIYLDLWHGKCRAARYLADAAAPGAEFRITASMEKWRKVLDGKLDPVQGMITRQIKLDGNLVKILKNVKAAQELVRCATRVPTDFD